MKRLDYCTLEAMRTHLMECPIAPNPSDCVKMLKKFKIPEIVE